MNEEEKSILRRLVEAQTNITVGLSREATNRRAAAAKATKRHRQMMDAFQQLGVSAPLDVDEGKANGHDASQGIVIASEKPARKNEEISATVHLPGGTDVPVTRHTLLAAWAVIATIAGAVVTAIHWLKVMK